MTLAEEAVARCRLLAAITDVAGETTRTFLSEGMRRANAQVATWMQKAGLSVHTDAAGNLHGALAGTSSETAPFLLASHLDTVPNAGAFDGMLGVVLDAEALYAELICDGIHTTPEAVRLWLRMKGLEHAMLVTDGMAATGMGDGNYLLGDLKVVVANGVCMSDGVLAGSVLTMDRAVRNVQAFTGIDPVPAPADDCLAVVGGNRGHDLVRRVVAPGQAGR